MNYNTCPDDVFEAIRINDLDYIINNYPNLDPNCVKVERYLRRDQNISRFATPILHLAIQNNRYHIVKYLIEKGADIEAPDSYDGNALHLANYVNHDDTCTVDIIILLLNNGANMSAVDCHGNSPLIDAVDAGYYNIVKILLDAGSDPNHVNQRHETALHFASRDAELNIIKLLLEYGADATILNDKGKSAEDIALKEGYDEIASYIRNYAEDLKEPEDMY